MIAAYSTINGSISMWRTQIVIVCLCPLVLSTALLLGVVVKQMIPVAVQSNMLITVNLLTSYSLNLRLMIANMLGAQ